MEDNKKESEEIKERKSEEIKEKDSEKVKERFEEIKKEIKENKLSIDQLYEWFKEELSRKDTEIQRLKKDNHILFMTALKAKDREYFEKGLKEGTIVRKKE
jgi:hypothetical protein